MDLSQNTVWVWCPFMLTLEAPTLPVLISWTLDSRKQGLKNSLSAVGERGGKNKASMFFIGTFFKLHQFCWFIFPCFKIQEPLFCGCVSWKSLRCSFQYTVKPFVFSLFCFYLFFVFLWNSINQNFWLWTYNLSTFTSLILNDVLCWKLVN